MLFAVVVAVLRSERMSCADLGWATLSIVELSLSHSLGWLAQLGSVSFPELEETRMEGRARSSLPP